MNPADIIKFIRKQFQEPEAFIPLHVPSFLGNEKKYVLETIESTFVSSVGAYVNRFEEMMCEITGAKHAIATVNGTTALHLALLMAGVKRDDLVITQALTFVATANAIVHAGASPVFVDVDSDTMGMSPEALEEFLKDNTIRIGNEVFSKKTNRRISAVMPMHTFGHPVRIEKIIEIANQYGIPVVEDTAESIGSYVDGKHTGTFGLLGAFSFNGNKTVTCGGGGAIITNDENIAKHAKHVSTTAKKPHPYLFFHDEIGYNYRMPNLNAALACAQLEQLDDFLKAKRELAQKYMEFFTDSDIEFKKEPKGTKSNYWLNAIQLRDVATRDLFLKELNDAGVMSRPIWTLMTKLPMYENCEHGDLTQSLFLEDRIINLPSSVIKSKSSSNKIEL
ncbi:MAG: LegC family aminotransferase [Bacteroidetes bacterium]|nr:LegC family aminotransferase [Bacteroidota bacterium]